jgi:hypothetical protein
MPVNRFRLRGAVFATMDDHADSAFPTAATNSPSSGSPAFAALPGNLGHLSSLYQQAQAQAVEQLKKVNQPVPWQRIDWFSDN